VNFGRLREAGFIEPADATEMVELVEKKLLS